MKRFNRMLSRLEICQVGKDFNEEKLYKDLWLIQGGWSNTTRGMILSMLKPDRANEIRESHIPPKKD